MLRAPLHIFERKDCHNDKFGGVWMCSNGSNVCTKDWGAPAVARANGGDRLIGISFLSDCKGNTLTLNVTSISSWIETVMAKEEPESECEAVYREDLSPSIGKGRGGQIVKIGKTFHFLVLTYFYSIVFL
ncbi:uncharacterized protein LOC141857862 [Brevipalpus obovatus]|uniref:uncharacterized protein LOC141857862 n=1 Tax=Brevipalpus obovatus TaxID=246614 RepID=UPI003D9F9F34